MKFPLDKIVQLQSTAYYRAKNFTADYFFLKRPDTIAKLSLLFRTLQACSLEFRT